MRCAFPPYIVGTSTRHAGDRGDQFLDLMTLLDHVARGESTRHTVRHVIPQHLFLDLVQRGADGIDLGQQIDAVAVLRDHALQAADLTLNPLQASDHGGLGRVMHPTLLRRRSLDTVPWRGIWLELAATSPATSSVGASGG